MMSNLVIVRAEWDDEASVWVATCDDIGLATEAESLERLRAKLPDMVQDLIGDTGGKRIVPIEIIAHSHTAALIGRPAA